MVRRRPGRVTVHTMHRRRPHRRVEAQQRWSGRQRRSSEEQIALLDARPGESTRERGRLKEDGA